MSEQVEIRRGATVTSLVDELATAVTADSLTIPADRAIDQGEWVRFVIRLEDGTDVIEGVARSRGSMPRGNPVSHYDLVLSDLQFDERNEIMWERLQIAAESAMHGDETGQVFVQEQRVTSPAQSAKTPPSASVPPPPPRPLGAPSRPPSKQPAASAPASGPSGKPVDPAAKSSKPAAAPSQPSRPPPLGARQPSKPPPSGAAQPSRPPPPRTPQAGTSASGQATPSPSQAPASHALAVPAELMARARRLATPKGAGAAGKDARPAEDAVLTKAIRVGLAALEAMGEAGEG